MFEFRQRVNRAGYCFVYCDRDIDLVVLETPGPEWFDISLYHDSDVGSVGLGNLIVTAPFEDATNIEKSIGDWPGLFLEFANTPLTAEGILTFANKWGLLSNSRSRLLSTDGLSVRSIRIQSEDSGDTSVHGEPLFKWLVSIKFMRHQWKIWEVIRDRNYEELARWITWTGASEVKCFNRVVASPENFPERLHRMQTGDLLQPARYLLEDSFTQFNVLAQGGLSAHLVWDHERDEWRTKVTPVDLMGALWLQFATTVSGQSQFRQCPECATWIEIAPGSGRPEKTYCSNACRMRAYRKRKGEGGS